MSDVTWRVTPERGYKQATEMPYGSLCADAAGVIYVRLRVDMEGGSAVFLAINSRRVVVMSRYATLRGPLELRDAYHSDGGEGGI